MSDKEWLEGECSPDYMRMMNVKSFILPMIGCWRDDVGWFKDTFSCREDDGPYYGYIHVAVKIGDEYQGALDRLKEHPNYVDNFDDDINSGHAFIVFSVPEKWENDFYLWDDAKTDFGKIDEISNAYKDVVRAKMAEKELDPRFFDLMIEDLKCQE